MKLLTRIVCLAGALLLGTGLFAQNRVSAVLIDESNGEPVGFATVSLTLDGAKKPSKYVLSEADGKVEISGVRAGSYTFKAELLGYLPYEKQIKVPDVKDLGEIRMKVDTQQLDAASVSAAGNPIIIKKDTIEYNATSFKTTENDVLEDLLKKLPGIEVSEDGSITHNGQTIKKITIDGKTFFLDDPQLASKNIPAKIINKLKVVDKKSDQAEFTGIDDGEEETIQQPRIQRPRRLNDGRNAWRWRRNGRRPRRQLERQRHHHFLDGRSQRRLDPLRQPYGPGRQLPIQQYLKICGRAELKDHLSV